MLPERYFDGDEAQEALISNALLIFTDGADWTEKAEGVELTNAQVWANLLVMGATEREKWFDMVRDASAVGQRCFSENHGALMHEAEWWRSRSNGYAIAATVQKADAETYYARMRRALDLAHHWRNYARNLAEHIDGKARMENP
jgi:hypothetical protein